MNLGYDAVLSTLKSKWHQIRSTLPNADQQDGGSPTTPILRLMSPQYDICTSHELLAGLLEVRDLLQPLAKACREKVAIIKLTNEKGGQRVGDIYSLSRRLGPYTKPPPEYNDPSGSDAICVPGYVFPCPDSLMMLRSTLFLGGAPTAMLRCLPPDIGASLKPGYLAVYQLELMSKTPNSQSFYSINLDSLRPFNPAQPPVLSAPGEYNIQAYSTANQFLPSELTMKTLTFEVAQPPAPSTASPKTQAATPPKEATTVRATAPVKQSAFGGLFLGEAESDDDDEEEDDDEEDDVQEDNDQL